VRSPARLLRARSGALPFVGRQGLLDDARKWLVEDRPFSGYLIGGRGGSGKTRMAVQLCLEAEGHGWLCGLLEQEAEPEAVETLAEVPTPRLIVVDYAEFRGKQLEVLLPPLVEGATPEHPVRVLLLVRSGRGAHDDWSEPLRGRGDWLDSALDDMDQDVLDDKPLDLADRTQLFSETVDALVRLYPAPTADGHLASAHERPDLLVAPDFGVPLLVVIAAYLSAHGEHDIPVTRSGLLQELVLHEDRYWRSTDVGGSLDQALRAQIVALGTLAGADTESEATQLLRLLRDLSDASAERLGQLARWVHGLYPGLRWWNSLEPDLLAEHLVATQLVDHPKVLSGVLGRTEATSAIQPLDLYARAVTDHEHLAGALKPVLRQAVPSLCAVAVHQAPAKTTNTPRLEASSLAGAIPAL
jgi:hypothetical protein